MKKVLIAATVPSMIGQFNMNNIEILQGLGYEVHVVCNFKDTSVWEKEKIDQFILELQARHIGYYQVDFSRSMFPVDRHIKTVKQLRNILSENQYDFIHCHTPIASVLCRYIAHTMYIKCIYTAHGFHFYNGASKKSWIVFYPIEKVFSRWTDILITINKEDFHRASEKFHMKRISYVPGVGVDTHKFAYRPSVYLDERSKLGCSKEDFMILSVGELNKNKNHSIVIRAIAKLNNKHVKYYIAGLGCLKEELLNLAEGLGVASQIHFLGYRNDIDQLMNAADLYVLPSIREGLNVSLMEAMASGLPCICGDIRGNCDLIENKKGGYRINVLDIDQWVKKIEDMLHRNGKAWGQYNSEKIENNFSSEKVNEKMKNIYLKL